MDRLCGLYARVSTEMQANKRDSSVDTQISQMKSFISYKTAGEQKWKIVTTYEEKGKSGKNTDRPELQGLFADIKSGKVNTVICTKIDRISRSLLDFYKMVDLFEKHNIEFVSLDENFDTSTPMGKAALKITLVFAELEREQTSKRTTEKMAWRAEQGLWNGGQVIGYDLIEKKLVVNKKESKVVKLIYTKYLELGSALQTALWLNNQGYRTKEYTANRSNVKHGGKKFTNSMIAQKLKSRVYIGEVGLKDKHFKGQHEPIIDRDLWKQANELIEKQAPTHRNPKQPMQHTFILQGLLECGWCGSFMTSKYCTGRGGKLHYYYQCTKNAHGGNDACEMKYVPANKLEKIVLDKIRLLSVDNAFLNQIVLKANESVNDELIILTETKKGQDSKLTAIKEQIDNLVTAIANKQIQDFKSVSEKLGKLEEQRDQLEKAIEGLAFQINEKKQKVFDAEIMHKSLTKFSQIYDKALPEEIKELLPYFVDRVTFKPDEIKIALFDQPAEKGLFVNHSSTGALELIEWLPREGSNLGQAR